MPAMFQAGEVSAGIGRGAAGVMHLRYWANIDSPGKHPQQVMRELGITYQVSTPQSIADQWWFWNCENIPSELPPFLEVMEKDPMDSIGWGLSQDEAESIRDYAGAKQP